LAESVWVYSLAFAIGFECFHAKTIGSGGGFVKLAFKVRENPFFEDLVKDFPQLRAGERRCMGKKELVFGELAIARGASLLAGFAGAGGGFTCLKVCLGEEGYEEGAG